MLKNILICLGCLFGLSFSTHLFAATACTVKTSSYLTGGTTVTLTTSSTTNPYLYQGANTPDTTIINCTTGAVTKTVTVSSSSYINLTSSVSDGSRTYFKIQNTSSPFLNAHGYVAYNVKETGSNTTVYSLDSTGLMTIFNSASGNGTQGLYLQPYFYFDAMPVTSVAIDFTWGALKTSMSSTTTTYADTSATLHTNLIFSPATTKTCTIPTTTAVVLPTTSVGSIGTDGAGSTRFSITASCTSTLAGTTLYGVMGDANTVSNVSTLLTNDSTTTATGVQIKVLDSSLNPITYGTEFTFGIPVLSSTSASTVTKTFYAKYYPVSTSVTSGTISAKAMLSVYYK